MNQPSFRFDNLNRYPLRSNKYWCSHCQRHFARLTMGEQQVSCPSCGTSSRRIGLQTPTSNPFEPLSDNSLQRTGSSDHLPDISDRNPLVEEIARRRQSSENSTGQIMEDPSLMVRLSDDLGRLNSNIANSDPHELDLTTQPSTQSTEHNQPPSQPHRHRLVLVHTIFLTGPNGGMIIRTTHLLPEPDHPSEPDTHMDIEGHTHETHEVHEEHEAQMGEASHDPHHHHHTGILEFLQNLNPMRLFGHQGNGMADERAQSEEESHEVPDISLHHIRSDPPDHENLPTPPMVGTRILINPFNVFSQGAFGLENLIEEIMRSMPDHNGPPPASDDALSKIVEFDYKPREEADICAVCHEDFHENEKVSKLPCKHEYHKDCVFKWLKMHNVCPICRQSISDETQNLVE